MHWRHAVTKNHEGALSPESTEQVFSGITTFLELHPSECLDSQALWSDSSERGNGVTRDTLTGTLCLTVGITTAAGVFTTYYAVRETCRALHEAEFFRLITAELRTHADDPR
jgi:hypothetical protein